ncbi:cytochrome P450 [Leucobacter weissii]|uniref:Cytochrome P450 n=1 Tax=Leucobacter weissii TaxID=1983706 RepID=A0A939MQD8_9MICO|nr:cytochrome P450 [Leucobacter weissii]MBO1902691.1 cytochrome P450 [Leucobacter weissii]
MPTTLSPSPPSTDLDLFASYDRASRLEQYRQLRDLSDVVRLEQHDVYAITSYDAVRSVLADHETFISGEGVGFTQSINEILRGTTLASDPPEHDLLRSVVATGLQPRAVRGRRDEIAEKARGVVTAALVKGADRGRIEGVTDLAQAMPLSVIPDFLGLPEQNRDRLFEWAQGGTDNLGPTSERTPHNNEMSRCIAGYTSDLAARRDLAPGSLGASVLAAADEGVIPEQKCPVLLIDYIGPSLETTATAIGHLLVTFAEHPEQWRILQEDPGLVASAINELVRYESPIRGFTRVAARDAEVSGLTIPAGSRVWTLLASANRDERKWESPDAFDVRRNPLDHLAFGYGTHGCAGQGVARLELHALFHALLDSVERIELIGEPVIAENSMLNTWASIPLRLVTTGGR